MTDKIKQYIIDNKAYLQRNDVEGFLKKIPSYARADVVAVLLTETSAPILKYLNEIPQNFLAGNRVVKNIVIPGNIKTIGPDAFSNSGLQNVQMESGVKNLGVKCFAKCEDLQVVDLSDTIEVIPTGAFMECYSLKKLFLPDSIKMIGAGAFQGCEDIEIIANYRTTDKMKGKRADIEFLKKHLKFTH